MSSRVSRARLRRLARRETVGVDVLAALNLVAVVTRYLAIAFAFPIAVALWHEESPWPFVIAAFVTAASGATLGLLTRGKERVGPREGFLVVALTWLVVAAAGALPYLLSDEPQLHGAVDAYFESMSGFTTTGASVVTDLESLDRSILMWRQFTQWLGGMGIIVLAVAVLPRLRVGGRQLFESEAPGPEIEPMAASIRGTARRLWVLYFVLTVACAVLLTGIGWLGIDPEMDVYDGVAHALTTLPTGGFGTKPDSFASFSPESQWVVTVFQILAGVNFALLFLAFARGRIGSAIRDEEARLYFSILAAATAALALILATDDVLHGEEAIRHAAFQAVTIMTTTGYASADFAMWPPVAAMLLVGLMFLGGSAGSTSGSVKIVRHLLVARILRRELDQTVHPELVAPIRLNTRPVDEKIVRAVIAFVLLYIGLFVVGAIIIAIDSTLTGVQIDAFDAIASSATALGNVGPSFGIAGPFGSFDPYSNLSKATLIVLMWLGRLELIPVLVLFTKHHWRA